MPSYSPQQGSFFAHKITLEGWGEDVFAQSLSTARVDMNPHQIDAALFALASPLNKGVLLADEVGLGRPSKPLWSSLRNGPSAAAAFC